MASRQRLQISKSEPIVTAKVGKNADLFPDILRLYVPPGSVIADVTYNRGRFWKGVQDMWTYTVLASDTDDVIMSKQPEMWDRALKLKADFTNLPYRDESLDAIVIDPPYGELGRGELGRKFGTVQSYNLGPINGTEALIVLYRKSILEAWRVLKQKGICIIKCQDSHESQNQRWIHIYLHNIAIDTGFVPEDLFVLMMWNTPIMRHDFQLHARKNHSYFWVFTKKATNRGWS